MFPNRSYPYLYYTVTPLFFLVHMQSRHTVSDVYKDPCIAVESSVRLQPTCSYNLSLRIGEPDCCAFTCCATGLGGEEHELVLLSLGQSYVQAIPEDNVDGTLLPDRPRVRLGRLPTYCQMMGSPSI